MQRECEDRRSRGHPAFLGASVAAFGSRELDYARPFTILIHLRDSQRPFTMIFIAPLGLLAVFSHVLVRIHEVDATGL
jgi:hypothetical protein